YAGANAGLTLTSSTLLGNSAALGGGGYNEAVAAGRRRVAITNSTLSGNSAGFSGGGVFNQAILSSANAELTLTNSTLSGNSASFSGGGVYNLAYAGASTLTLTRSLLSGNTAPTGAEVLNFSGTLTATDHNLLGHSGFTNAQAFAAFTPGATDITATSDGTTPTALSAILDPTLADNSGPTLTHALVSGSPAIDAVATGCPPPSTDQRGVPRPQDGNADGIALCDIGAVELAAAPIAVQLDIKPGEFPNSINPQSKGVIPVAILTTATFDATTVDPPTVLFGATGTEAAPVHSALQDVDGDGDTDLLLHFRTQATGLRCGDTSASLTGETVSGEAIAGSDAIRTVGCKQP